MFWILEIFPYWIWWLLLIAGLSAYFLVGLVPVITYRLPIKILSGVVVAATIFIFGLLYADGVWQAAARELQAQVKVAEAKSQAVSDVIQERVVYKTQVIKQRENATVEYITREITKHDSGCTIPQEFITVHNRAAEIPK